MGLLDNSNNVISVDAVLTDLGREKISRNDGSFEIIRFAFGDDEVNYNLFTPNTGSLQQDTDIMNSPIFEASVNEKIALKYPLITITNPNLKYLPTVEATVTSLTLGEKTDALVGKTVEFRQKMQTSGRVVPSEIVDPSFIITMDKDLMYVEKRTPVSITPFGTSQYVIPRTALAADQGAKIAFNVAVQSLTDDLWDTLGSGTVGSRTISTKIKCKGVVSGISEEVSVTIDEEFTR